MVARFESEAGLTTTTHQLCINGAKYSQGWGEGGGTAAECNETLTIGVDFL